MNKELSDQFVEEWKIYLGNVGEVMNRKLDSIFENGNSEAKKTFTSLKDNVLGELEKSDCIGALSNSVNKFGDEVIFRFLLSELKFFNELVSEIGQTNNNPDSKINMAVSSAGNIKDSIEKMFTLPGWLKNILSVLNELLGMLPV